ncbi:type VII secretion-associated serine protease mycosin [Streptomyces purpureus]|uniref:type VII secretion-associated serine protease mycosin n=1 Tax=Streptomyces purpureus TaxID=1951 RepID=UPI00048BD87D|nr:type VII secretion-associated serine protease mycosin [Streptomyces purpureus]
MRTSSIRSVRGRAVVSTALGMLLVGIASVPAHAETIRSKQWHLDAMGAEKIWKLSTGEGVTVAVIDTGVDKNNPDLVGRVLKGKNLEPNQPGDEQTDHTGHGTGMAGLIAGTGKSGGGDGAFGLAPGAKILPIRMPKSGTTGTQKEGDLRFNQKAPVAIRFAADAGAKVINISLAVKEGSHQLTEAVQYALDKGALVFAGVGNNGHLGNRLEYPAATPGVVGVGAIDKNLKKIKVSQSGPQVDVVAPGDKMVHACGGKTGLCETSGTSDATALASATAALIWSKHPDWTNNQVLKVMLNTVSGSTTGEKRSDFIGYGALRPLRALKSPGDPGPADVYPLPDLAAAEAKSPSPQASSPASTGTGTDKASSTPVADSQESGGKTGLWIGLGVAAVVLIGAAVAVPLVRGRRSA